MKTIEKENNSLHIPTAGENVFANIDKSIYFHQSLKKPPTTIKKKTHDIIFQKATDQHPILRLVVANTCNLHCPYCHVFKESQHYSTNLMRLMTPQLAITAIQNFKKYLEESNGLSPWISFYGGEALLNKKVICAVYDYCGSWPVGYIINTNGTPINQKILSSLPKEKVEYHISLDGAEKQNNQTRQFSSGEGVYQKVSQNIILLKKNGFAVQINFMITMANIDFLHDFVSTLVELKIKKLYFDIAKEVYQNISTEMLATTIVKFLACCSKNEIMPSGPWKILLGTANSFLKTSKAKRGAVAPHMLAPELNLEVHPDGKVYSPHYLPQESIGLHKELQSVELMGSYSKALQGAKKLQEGCQACIFKNRCGASLRYVWQYHYENTTQAHLACDVFRSIAEAAIKNIYFRKNKESMATHVV